MAFNNNINAGGKAWEESDADDTTAELNEDAMHAMQQCQRKTMYGRTMNRSG